MLAMQPQPTQQHVPLGMNVKSAMAANLGSSLFLFQGLHRISPYVLGQLSSTSSSPASSSSSSTRRESRPTPSYFRFELLCSSCRRGCCPIALDYNSKVRIGYSVSTSSRTPTTATTKKMTKKQAIASSSTHDVKILGLDLCSYSRKVTLTRDIVSRRIGVSYVEGEASWSKPKEVDFDGLLGDLEGGGVEYEVGEKKEDEEEEREDLEEEAMSRRGGGYKNNGYEAWGRRQGQRQQSYRGGGGGGDAGHSRYPSSSSSSSAYSRSGGYSY